MPTIVALDLPGGPAFVEALQRVWDAGDVAFPVDQRLPTPLRTALLDDFGVGAIVDRTGQRVGRRGGAAESVDPPPVESDDALVVATSGSTGRAKGVVLTHDAVRASAEATSRRLAVTHDDHWLACLPLSHVGGLSVVTRALHSGTRLTVHPSFDASAVERAGATLVSLVATALRRIDPALFRRIVLGGAHPPADLPPNVSTTYGMTETGSGVVYDGVPLDGVEVRIVDGEIHVRGPMLLRRYLHTADVFDAEGWFATGDLGDVADGLLTVHGRRGDLIITGGENVWPEPVERVLATHPGIADVGIVGTPDPEWGELVTAVLVPIDATRPVGLDEVRDWVKASLPAVCAPRRVVYRSELPRSTLGKLIRSELDPVAQ